MTDKFSKDKKKSLLKLNIITKYSYKLKKIIIFLVHPFRVWRYYKNKRLIIKSGLFDIEFYYRNNKNMLRDKFSPLDHFMLEGYKKKINPHPAFDVKYYLNNSPDVEKSGTNPLLHYIKFGVHEGRKPHPLYKKASFQKIYTDIIALTQKAYLKENSSKKKLQSIKKLFMLVNYIKHNPSLLKKALNNLSREGLRPTLTKIKTNIHYNIAAIKIACQDHKFYKLPLSKRKKKYNLKTAVVIHAFYSEILEEIIFFLKNIKPRPDLFISVSQKADTEKIKKILLYNKFNNFRIIAVPNRGRDVAPFLIEFASKIKNYDLCCKIHAKKSLYTGNDRSDWRQHIYYNLLGNKYIVNDIISRLANDKKLGMVFSDNFGMLPYWGYCWLTNKNIVTRLLKRLKLQPLLALLHYTYIDFPAGTMFWFKPRAIKQILDNDFQYEDFPAEPIPNDCTIAHGLERLFSYVTGFNGYDFIELNYKRGLYTKNYCHKNFYQLEAKTIAKIKEIIIKYEFIIFDIFDTLISRNLFYPDNVFRILEHKINKKFNIKSDFFNIRKHTENSLRNKVSPDKDVSYKDIYTNMGSYCNYTKDIITFAEKKEFELELKILKVKPEVKEVLDFAREQNKKIIFVSDMYLNYEQITYLLKKMKINIKNLNIFLSSAIGYRKDNSTIWKYLIDKSVIKPAKSMVIGDNEVSDVKIPGDFNITNFHLLSERNCFFESYPGKQFSSRFTNINPNHMILLGPVINFLFHSPFNLKNTVLNFNKKLSPYEFGYTAVAPFMYIFVNHLYKKHKDKKIFFLAREGHFIKDIFTCFITNKKLPLTEQPKYLLVSRRALLGAVKQNETTLKNIILELGDYKGKLSELLLYRLGIGEDFLKKNKIKDFNISDYKGLEKAYKILRKNIKAVNACKNNEHNAYKKYLQAAGFFNNKQNVVVDLGYSGTMQNYLAQLSKQKLIGEYFITTEKVKHLNRNNTFNGFFADKIAIKNTTNIIYKYSLILEAFLTSDKGQLIAFKEQNSKILPVYKTDKNDLTISREITRGIKDYIKELHTIDYDFFNFDNKELKTVSVFMFDYIIKNRLVNEKLKSLFFLEDDFTGNNKLNILDIFDKRGI